MNFLIRNFEFSDSVSFIVISAGGYLSTRFQNSIMRLRIDEVSDALFFIAKLLLCCLLPSELHIFENSCVKSFQSDFISIALTEIFLSCSVEHSLHQSSTSMNLILMRRWV